MNVLIIIFAVFAGTLATWIFFSWCILIAKKKFDDGPFFESFIASLIVLGISIGIICYEFTLTRNLEIFSMIAGNIIGTIGAFWQYLYEKNLDRLQDLRKVLGNTDFIEKSQSRYTQIIKKIESDENVQNDITALSDFQNLHFEISQALNCNKYNDYNKYYCYEITELHKKHIITNEERDTFLYNLRQLEIILLSTSNKIKKILYSNDE